MKTLDKGDNHKRGLREGYDYGISKTDTAASTMVMAQSDGISRWGSCGYGCIFALGSGVAGQ